LLTWLRLYTILTKHRGWDERAQAYEVNPFEGVKNPVGRVITQARNRTLAPLREEDLAELWVELGAGGEGQEVRSKWQAAGVASRSTSNFPRSPCPLTPPGPSPPGT
jgi:hypothetical protein